MMLDAIPSLQILLSPNPAENLSLTDPVLQVLSSFHKSPHSYPILQALRGSPWSLLVATQSFLWASDSVLPLEWIISVIETLENIRSFFLVFNENLILSNESLYGTPKYKAGKSRCSVVTESWGAWAHLCDLSVTFPTHSPWRDFLRYLGSMGSIGNAKGDSVQMKMDEDVEFWWAKGWKNKMKDK